MLPAILVLSVVASILILAGLIINGPRVWRWHKKAKSEGRAMCRECGHVGALSYGLLPGKPQSSTHIRLICEKCDSEDWFVPGGSRDRRRSVSGDWFGKRDRRRKGTGSQES